MKILAIRGKNIASLQGEFNIDFEVEPLRSAPFFAITGPTGSGKSTLLDVICLALFDDTPRINQAADNATILDVKDKPIKQKDSRTLLRKGSVEGYAQVDFRALSGEKYSARWRVKRARNKVDGALQNGSYEVWNLTTNTPLQGGKMELLSMVKELIGLSFDQFTRAVLLAQGDFATFLKASTKEKGDLLEKLTGTNVYSKISMRIYELTKEAETELSLIQERIKDVVLLSQEQIETLTSEKCAISQDIFLCETQIKTFNEKILWIETAERLTQEVAKALQTWEKRVAAIAESKPRFEEMSRLDSVQPIRDHYKQLELEQKQLYEAERSLNQQQSLLITNNQLLFKAKEELALDKTTSQLYRAEWEKTEPHSKEARKLEVQIEELTKNLVVTQREVTQATEQSAKCEKEIKANEIKINDFQKAQEEIIQWCQKNERFSQIVPRIELISSYINDAQSANDRIFDNNRLLTASREALSKEEARLATQQAEALRLNNILPSEIALLRARLSVNEPCPVCGSTLHPILETARPMMQIHSVDPVDEAHIQNIQEKALNKAKEKVTREIELLTKKVEGLKAEIIQLQSLISQYAASHNATLDKLKTALNPIPGWEDSFQKGTLNNHLKTVATKWNNLLKDQNSLAEQLLVCKQTILATRERWNDHNHQLAEKRKQHTTISAELAQLTERRKEVLQGENADAVEKYHLERIKTIENQIVKNSERQSDISSKGEKIAGEITQITHQASLLTQSIESLQKSVLLWLSHRDDNLTLEELTRLLNKESAQLSLERESLNKLQKEELTAHSTLLERQRVFQAHQQLPIQPSKEESKDFLSSSLNLKIDLINQKRERDAEIGMLFENHRLGKERIKQFEEVIAQKSAIAHNWSKLNNLFGSADGNKFRVLAQGYTLEVLLDYANNHLKNISQRYLLERVSPESLSLQVIDLDMLSEVRSVHSLSGGESFLISLALALGLSSLSSNRMRVESLFIDEGFGTLDADTLHVAMDALERLQTEGRKIGVISHVAEMTERISTQIRVIKTANGKSKVEVIG